MLSSKVLNLLLLPAFVLAQLLCVCGTTTAQAYASPAVQSQKAAVHDCCKDEDGPEDGTPKSDPHHHNSPCHCTGLEGKVIVSERIKAPDVQVTLLPFQLFPPIAYLLPEVTTSRLQSFTPWLSDLSPPPDLLRVKCTLQI